MPVAIRGARVAVGCVLAALLVMGTLVLVLTFTSPAGDPVARRTPTPTPDVQAALSAMSPCERLALSRERRLEFARGTGDTVLVIGDSWATGAKLPPSARAWTSFIPGRVRVDGVPGSGFSPDALGCAGLSYAERIGSAVAATTPDLVVVQGGLNDADVTEEEIRRGFFKLALEAGDERVVVLGPTLAPARATSIPRVDQLLADLSRAAGFEYVSTTDLDLVYLGDGLHLTRKGHEVLGEAVAARIGELLSK